LKRTIEEAVDIAKRHGVEVPEYVEFFEAEPGELGESLRGFYAGQRDSRRREGRESPSTRMAESQPFTSRE
jgi:hypothetical protein